MTDRQVPGFTADQTWSLKALIRDAVREANDHDERVTALQECVFGNGKEGVKTTVVKLGKDVASLVWWYRLLVAAVVGSWLTILVNFLTS
jgi:hypothetical protein